MAKNWACGIGIICLVVIGLTAGHVIFATTATVGVCASACALAAASYKYYNCIVDIGKYKVKQAEAKHVIEQIDLV